MKKLAHGSVVRELKEVLVTVVCVDGFSHVDVFPSIESAVSYVASFLSKHACDVFDVRLVPVFK